MEKENIIKEIKAGITRNESSYFIARTCGVSQSYIIRTAKKHGISFKTKPGPAPTKLFRPKHCLNCGKEYKGSGKKYCSIACFVKHKLEREFNKRYNEWVTNNGRPPPLKSDGFFTRKRMLEEQQGVCAICGMEPIWQGKPLIFILDHIDGNRRNNSRNNFRLVCSNCNSQLDTFAGRNVKRNKKS